MKEIITLQDKYSGAEETHKDIIKQQEENRTRLDERVDISDTLRFV